MAAFTTSTLAPGSSQISATYTGSSRYSSSQSPSSINELVQNTTTTVVTATPNPSTYPGLTLNAQVTPNPAYGSTVQFFNGSTSLGYANLNGSGLASLYLALPVGTSTITATFVGDGSNQPSTSSAVAVTVNKANLTTTLAASPSPSTVGQSVTLIATLTPYTTGTVQFFNGATLLGTATIANSQAQITITSLPGGTNSFTATSSGDANTYGSTSAAVLLNLLLNACQSGSRDAIDVSVTIDGTRCLIEIADRGSGFGTIDPERLFEAFHTTKKSGTGLGLAIVRRLVTLQGGAVTLAPRDGGGVTARVTLPARGPVLAA